LLLVRIALSKSVLKLTKKLGGPVTIPVRHALMKQIACAIVPLGLLCLFPAMPKAKAQCNIDRRNQGQCHHSFQRDVRDPRIKHRTAPIPDMRETTFEFRLKKRKGPAKRGLFFSMHRACLKNLGWIFGGHDDGFAST